MRGIILMAAVAAIAGTASAQSQPGPFIYKPIDTNKYLVQPTDAAASVTAGATSSTFRTITRTIASTIENNGFVRTINNVFGRRAKPDPVQPGFSPLPTTGTYQSTSYPNAFTPAMPVAGTAGRTPNVVMPASPSPQK
jgi:hypothetical protein